MNKYIDSKKFFEIVDEAKLLNMPCAEVLNYNLEALGIDSLHFIELGILFEDQCGLKANILELNSKTTLLDFMESLQPIK